MPKSLSKPSSDPTPQAVQDCHEHLVWIIQHLDRFPRSRRFTLGERLESGVLEVLEHLVEAAYSRDKIAGDHEPVSGPRREGRANSHAREVEPGGSSNREPPWFF